MKKRLLTLLCIALVSIMPLFAEETKIPGLNYFKLDNGLELFVLENHAVPLTTVEITFRCGSITQTPETAGLFHLYEHMMFKGNSKYKTETEFSAAMTDLGVSSWNGGTSTEYVTYYFTVPSNSTEQGLEFWSHAVREPLFDEEELTIEKDVVVNEIKGYFVEPNEIFTQAENKALFKQYPWRRDVGGYEAAIRNTTPDTLRNIQKQFYIPNNAALFVCGDVNPEEVLAMANKWYGTWEKGDDPWKNPTPSHPTQKKPTYLVYPDESLPEGIAYLELKYRGPDVLTNPEPTYAADIWGSLIANPNSRFKNTIMQSVPGLYNKDYINGFYYTQRDGGQIQFSTYCFTDPSLPLAKRAQDNFIKVLKDNELSAMTKPSYFDTKEFEIVKQKLEDDQIISLEKPSAFISTLSFWWAVSSANYYFDYVENMKKVTTEDIASFITDYIIGKPEVVAFRVNPADFNAEKDSFKKAGFLTIDSENAFWWKDSNYFSKGGK